MSTFNTMRICLGTFVTLLLFSGKPCLAEDDPLSGGLLFTRVEQYAGFGDHRSGTAGDHATAGWLENLLLGSGYQVERLPFKLKQFFPAEQTLAIGEEHLPVFPHWFPKSTTGAITAPIAALSQADLSGYIAYLAPEQAGEWYQVQPAELAKQAQVKGALALVIAVPHPSLEIYQTNAAPPFIDRELPIPVTIIAARHSEQLQAALNSNREVTLTSTGSIKQVSANNLVARYPAQADANKPWVVVSTPISGWFQCAGERGSGVALWAGLAQWVASQQYQQVNWLFVGNSGHELDMMGVQHSMPHMPEPAAVKLWLHLGASIAARQWQQEDDRLLALDKVHEYNRLYSAATISPYISASFAEVPDLELLPSSQLQRSTSELGHILADGYPAAGMVGSHRFFHTPLDTPAVTSPALLAPYGEALRELSRLVTQTQ